MKNVNKIVFNSLLVVSMFLHVGFAMSAAPDGKLPTPEEILNKCFLNDCSTGQKVKDTLRCETCEMSYCSKECKKRDKQAHEKVCKSEFKSTFMSAYTKAKVALAKEKQEDGADQGGAAFVGPLQSAANGISHEDAVQALAGIDEINTILAELGFNLDALFSIRGQAIFRKEQKACRKKIEGNIQFLFDQCAVSDEVTDVRFNNIILDWALSQSMVASITRLAQIEDFFPAHTEHFKYKFLRGKTCASCLKKEDATKFSFCSQCKVVKYCSKECQKTHWKSHKSACQKPKDERTDGLVLPIETDEIVEGERFTQEQVVLWRDLDELLHCLNTSLDEKNQKKVIEYLNKLFALCSIEGALRMDLTDFVLDWTDEEGKDGVSRFKQMEHILNDKQDLFKQFKNEILANNVSAELDLKDCVDSQSPAPAPASSGQLEEDRLSQYPAKKALGNIEVILEQLDKAIQDNSQFNISWEIEQLNEQLSRPHIKNNEKIKRAIQEKVLRWAKEPGLGAVQRIELIRRIDPDIVPVFKKQFDFNEACMNCSKIDGGTKFSCGQCKAVKYCSKECQKNHWKSGHKKTCISKKQEVLSGQGGFVAAQGVSIRDKYEHIGVRFKRLLEEEKIEDAKQLIKETFEGENASLINHCIIEDECCDKYSLLDFAIIHNQLGLVKFLIEHGMDVNLREEDFVPSLVGALDIALKRIKDFQYGTGDGREAVETSLSIIRHLIMSGSDLNCCIKDRKNEEIGLLCFVLKRSSEHKFDCSRVLDILIENGARLGKDEKRLVTKEQIAGYQILLSKYGENETSMQARFDINPNNRCDDPAGAPPAQDGDDCLRDREGSPTEEADLATAIALSLQNSGDSSPHGDVAAMYEAGRDAQKKERDEERPLAEKLAEARQKLISLIEKSGSKKREIENLLKSFESEGIIDEVMVADQDGKNILICAIDRAVDDKEGKNIFYAFNSRLSRLETEDTTNVAVMRDAARAHVETLLAQEGMGTCENLEAICKTLGGVPPIEKLDFINVLVNAVSDNTCGPDEFDRLIEEYKDELLVGLIEESTDKVEIDLKKGVLKLLTEDISHQEDYPDESFSLIEALLIKAPLCQGQFLVECNTCSLMHHLLENYPEVFNVKIAGKLLCRAAEKNHMEIVNCIKSKVVVAGDNRKQYVRSYWKKIIESEDGDCIGQSCAMCDNAVFGFDRIGGGIFESDQEIQPLLSQAASQGHAKIVQKLIGSLQDKKIAGDLYLGSIQGEISTHEYCTALERGMITAKPCGICQKVSRDFVYEGESVDQLQNVLKWAALQGHVGIVERLCAVPGVNINELIDTPEDTYTYCPSIKRPIWQVLLEKIGLCALDSCPPCSFIENLKREGKLSVSDCGKVSLSSTIDHCEDKIFGKHGKIVSILEQAIADDKQEREQEEIQQRRRERFEEVSKNAATVLENDRLTLQWLQDAEKKGFRSGKETPESMKVYLAGQLSLKNGKPQEGRRHSFSQ